MNNDDFKEVPDNIQDNNEETTNNIDNTNDNKANDYEDVCYICRRPESVAGKMIHIPGGILTRTTRWRRIWMCGILPTPSL